MLKPEALQDTKLAALPDREWRVFISLLLVADDYGNFSSEPELLTASMYWAHPAVTLEALSSALDELERQRFIRRYVANAQKCGSVLNWAKHQRISKPGKPKVPQPEQTLGLTRQLIDDVAIEADVQGALRACTKLAGADFDAIAKGLLTLGASAVASPDRLLQAVRQACAMAMTDDVNGPKTSVWLRKVTQRLLRPGELERELCEAEKPIMSIGPSSMEQHHRIRIL